MALFDLPGRTILLHSRLGLRVELNVDRVARLELWLSPLAGSSIDARVRNFSNRDDHLRVFDRIEFPGLSEASFLGCAYDPIETLVRFRGVTLRLRVSQRVPGVVFELSRAGVVDFKSDKAAVVESAGPELFCVRQSDRGLRFRFAASSRGPSFSYAPQIEEGRSTYARASLAAGEALSVVGDVADRPADGWASTLSLSGVAAVRGEEEPAIAAAMSRGRSTLRGRARLQRMLERSRRELLALEDASGAVRAAMQRIYYMIWVRDGAMIQVFRALAGDAAPLARWCEFLLSNPTRIRDERPRGRTFLMLVQPGLTKWEEDGVFFAIWSAYMHWTHTGERRFIRGRSLAVLEEAMGWLERYCFDRSRGLFGRYFACETPLAGSRDFGWDNALGRPVDWGAPRWGGVEVTRSYDVYINSLAYASYRMLALMVPASRAAQYARRAERLKERCSPWFERDLPPYGDLQLADGRVVEAGPHGLDPTDYVWAMSLPPFAMAPERMAAVRSAVMKDVLSKPRGKFLAGILSLAASMLDSETEGAEVLGAFDECAARCFRETRGLPMRDTVVERLDVPDTEVIRPQAFSVGPWLAARAGLGLRRLPQGLAVRPGAGLTSIEGFSYRGRSINARFSGRGEHVRVVTVDGVALEGSLVVPEQMLGGEGEALEIAVRRGVPRPARSGPVLAWTDARLERVADAADGRSRRWAFSDAAGGVAAFSNLADDVVLRANGSLAEPRSGADGLTWIELGRSKRVVVVSEPERR